MEETKVTKNLLRKMEKNKYENSEAYRAVIQDLIPGGAHTYSKGDDQFPQLSPAAISHGKGAYVWDIDGNKFLDCAMGLTSVSLGHAYEPVLEKVRAELEKGVNFQRPSYIEKDMAESFLSLVPCHSMIKFAKNGSSVTTAAVKLARAYTGRDLVAFPSDHPFYSVDDWFIGKSVCDRGVPEKIKELSVTFKSFDIASLKELFEKYPNQISCVITEPEKEDSHPTGEYLKEAIELAHQHGALFIIDEMISGFKTAFPGAVTKFNLQPDMCTWGKGIANGFSFCALTGKKEVMELGGIRKEGEAKVFLASTTHGGETHAIAAGLATIEVFKKHKVIEHNHHIGELLMEGLRKTISEKGLEKHIAVGGTKWFSYTVYKDENGAVSMPLRTLVLQEMISRGILYPGVFVPCFSHTENDVEFLVNAFAESCDIFKLALVNGVDQYLVGPATKPVFRKYL
jgi:glutamate-1-semialdehyde 2,1-aminomutase